VLNLHMLHACDHGYIKVRVKSESVVKQSDERD